MSESEFCTAVAVVAKLEHDCKLWIADAALVASTRWGQRGLEIMARATNLKTCSLKHASYTAAAFPVGKRYDYNYNSLRFMKPYAHADEKWTDAFLARHKDDKVSSRDLRALAQKEYGTKDGESKKKPVERRSSTKCSVTLPTSLYARLRLHAADRKISVLISEICEQWISKQPVVAVSHIREVNERKAARQKVREEKVTAKAQMHEAKRASYAERRQAQLDAGAARIADKADRPKKPGKLQRQWVDCKPLAMVDGEYGPTTLQNKSTKFPTKFWSEADAQAADQEFFKRKGFHQLVVKCPVCSASSQKRDCWHVRWDAASVRLAQEMVQSVTDRSAVQQVSSNA